MHVTTLQYVLKKRRFRKLLGMLILAAILLTVAIVPIERSVGGPIQNLFDALWWSVSTLTSTGYGDILPVTVIGKFIGMALQLIGALIFGVMIALVSITLNRAEDEFILMRMRDRFDDVGQKLDRMERQINYLIRKEDERQHAQELKKKKEE